MNQSRQPEMYRDPYSKEEMELAERLRQKILNPSSTVEVFPMAEVYPIRGGHLSEVTHLGQSAVMGAEGQEERRIAS